jgi:hypothetical protein
VGRAPSERGGYHSQRSSQYVPDGEGVTRDTFHIETNVWECGRKESARGTGGGGDRTTCGLITHDSTPRLHFCLSSSLSYGNIAGQNVIDELLTIHSCCLVEATVHYRLGTRCSSFSTTFSPHSLYPFSDGWRKSGIKLLSIRKWSSGTVGSMKNKVTVLIYTTCRRFAA